MTTPLEAWVECYIRRVETQCGEPCVYMSMGDCEIHGIHANEQPLYDNSQHLILLQLIRATRDLKQCDRH